MTNNPTISGSPEDQAKRREFLKECGRFAAVTSPAMTLLLSVAEMPKEAHASTIGHHWDRKDKKPKFERRGGGEDD